MRKKSKRFFLEIDYCPGILPTDDESTLRRLGIEIDWNAYHALFESENILEAITEEHRRVLEASLAKNPNDFHEYGL